ncbi:hypothetical protein EV401DRAFT_1895354 [Pisolithus croceorrhizus]|nr:hypothetical protein EV401DRAFT_1895354 [Pisolithus croceorrhizus]
MYTRENLEYFESAQQPLTELQTSTSSGELSPRPTSSRAKMTSHPGGVTVGDLAFKCPTCPTSSLAFRGIAGRGEQLQHRNTNTNPLLRATTILFCLASALQSYLATPKHRPASNNRLSLWKVNPHVSAIGGIGNAVRSAARTRVPSSLAIKNFHSNMQCQRIRPLRWIAASYDRLWVFASHVLMRGSYLTNLGNPDNCVLAQVRESTQLSTKEHFVTLTPECIDRAREAGVNLTYPHRLHYTCSLTVNPSSHGAENVISSKFSELRSIINHVESKDRVGECLDTCHLVRNCTCLEPWETGWDYVCFLAFIQAMLIDVSSAVPRSATISESHDIMGPSYLWGLHPNDARTALGSKKDKRENMRLGSLTLTFHAVLPGPSNGSETDSDGVWAAGIRVLYRKAEI